MTIKYFLSSRFSMEISTFLESYLKCLNAVRVLNLSDDVQIVICFPNENQKMIQLIPVHLRGVSIVSPLWALSSIICKALQPVEFYSTLSEKIFSGVILSFRDQSIQSSQKLSAYASYIRNYGGQVFEKSFPFHTHQYVPPEDLSMTVATRLEDKSFNSILLELYAYFLSSFHLSSHTTNSISSSSMPFTLPLFPISVTGLWIESSIQSLAYLSSSLLSSSLHKASWSDKNLTCSELITKMTQQFSASQYFMSLQATKSHSLPWDHSLSDCTYLPLLQTVIHESPGGSQTKRVFPDQLYFLISPQYSYGFRENMKEVIRFLGGIVVPSMTSLPSFCSSSSSISLYLISRNTSCPFLSTLKSTHLSILLHSVSHIYLYSCLLYLHFLPTNSSLPDSETISDSWKTLYPPETGKQQTHQVNFYQSLTTLFSFLYSPPTLPLSSNSLRIPDLMNCVVTLSGYRDRDTRSLLETRGDSPSEEIMMTVSDDNGERYGRRELKQAIRLSGACYSGPLLSHVVTHLVCSSPAGKKYLYALSTQRPHQQPHQQQQQQTSLSHPIHIVNEMWILDCIRYQRRMKESHYLPHWMQQRESHVEHEQEKQGEEKGERASAQRKGNHNKSTLPTSAIQALLKRVQSSHNDAEEFQYGPEAGGEAEEEEQEEEEEDLSCCQHESEVIEEEALEEEVWNERKMDHRYEKEPEEDKEAIEDLISPIKQPPVVNSPPVFLLGGGSHAKYRSLEQDAREIITRLGGVVLSTNSSYATCTHLILWELKRTEKFLCCCVSGKWILHPEYLIQSAAQGTFLPEKPYEWNEQWITGPNPPVVEKTIWLGACRRGRLQALRGQLPYQDLKVVIDLRQVPSGVTLGPPVETLVRIIESGGGHVLEIITGDEDTEEEMEICKNPRIDYFVRYPCSSQQPLLDHPPRPHNLVDNEDDEIISSHLVSVVLVGYFLDRISQEKVDIREYIVTRARSMNTHRRRRTELDETQESQKKQRSV